MDGGGGGGRRRRQAAAWPRHLSVSLSLVGVVGFWWAFTPSLLPTLFFSAAACHRHLPAALFVCARRCAHRARRTAPARYALRYAFHATPSFTAAARLPVLPRTHRILLPLPRALPLHMLHCALYMRIRASSTAHGTPTVATPAAHLRTRTSPACTTPGLRRSHLSTYLRRLHLSKLDGHFPALHTIHGSPAPARLPPLFCT